MTKYNYSFTDKRVSEAEEFAEASVTELRVLLALIDLEGECDEDTLVERAACSKARVLSALALWEEVGIILPRSEEDKKTPYGNRVTEEFADSVRVGELIDESSAEIACTIRSHKLADLFDECAVMMGKAMLSPMEIRNIAVLVSQLALSEEYILTLCAHIREKGELTVYKLTNKAKKLVENGIQSVEELEVYISEMESRGTSYTEYRKLFGIFGRNFSPSERKYFDKWSNEYAFGIEIVGMAYDICALNTSKLQLKYIDGLLTDWHSAGCKTVEQCERRYEAVKLQRDAERAAKEAEGKAQRVPARGAAKEKPRYGSFDPTDAMRRAIERSYASKKAKSDTETDGGDEPKNT
ncbi:MAG: DnaD domain protein [Clostridia bacterium]|nr:DnaD domain protein [Clostridia bacterium]